MHDYNPEWDYEIDEEPNAEICNAAEEYLPELQKIASQLSLGEITIAYVIGLEDHLARYCSGTYESPVIVCDSEALLKGCVEYGVSLQTAVQTTLLHEVAHAYIESCGVFLPNEEEVAESFAHTVWEASNAKEAVRNLQALTQTAELV